MKRVLPHPVVSGATEAPQLPTPSLPFPSPSTLPAPQAGSGKETQQKESTAPGASALQILHDSTLAGDLLPGKDPLLVLQPTLVSYQHLQKDTPQPPIALMDNPIARDTQEDRPHTQVEALQSPVQPQQAPVRSAVIPPPLSNHGAQAPSAQTNVLLHQQQHTQGAVPILTDFQAATYVLDSRPITLTPSHSHSHSHYSRSLTLVDSTVPILCSNSPSFFLFCSLIHQWPSTHSNGNCCCPNAL